MSGGDHVNGNCVGDDNVDCDGFAIAFDCDDGSADDVDDGFNFIDTDVGDDDDDDEATTFRCKDEFGCCDNDVNDDDDDDEAATS
jgi:hypothetical protein